LELAWRVHPASRRPATAVAVLGVVGLASFWSARVGGHGVWGVTAATFLIATVASFLFPTRYRLTDEGVEVRLLGARRRRAWAGLHVVAEGGEGLLLSPSRRRGIFDPVRTILLRYEGNAAQVRRFVEERIG
jgi:hypothetical protein